MHILLIEDDKKLAAIVKKVLTTEKFTVDCVADGNIGLEAGLQGTYDVIVVDWMLPGRDGPSICQALRAAHISSAILILTARSQVEDRVAGLYSGADDYLGKPFSFDELIARIYALGRRRGASDGSGSELRLGNLVMDGRTSSARRRDRLLDLTHTEWLLLECLMRHPDQTLTREFIRDYVWSFDSTVQTSLVDVYVSYLRNKMKVPGLKDPIVTRRGFGYALLEENA
jgi:two-component system OmpR family response regulator